MPTPAWRKWVELVGATSTLTLGTLAVRITDGAGLLDVGRSRGDDIVYAREDGGDPGPRYLAPLKVGVGIQIVGKWDQDGAAVADPVVNAETLQALVAGWPDLNDRSGTVTLHRTGMADLSATFRFDGFTGWTNPEPHIYETELLLTVPDGRLT